MYGPTEPFSQWFGRATATERGRNVRSAVPTRGFVSHLDLNVSDPSRSIPLYGLVLEHLGYRRHWVEPETRCAWWIRHESGAIFGIEIRPPAEPAPRSHHERYAPGIDHLAFHAESPADVDSLYEVLVANGVPVAEPPREYDYAPGYYAVAFDDPDGIRLEVVHEPSSNP